MHLQRLIGNRATISTLSAPRHRLQRDLDADALAVAMQHYSDHSDDYPSFLIRRVQHHFNVSPVTGRMNEATIQAIARRQERAIGGMTMRGIPSPATGIVSREDMVDMVAVGLEERSERTEYVEGAGELSARWASLSPDARLAEFSRLGNERLESVGVPRIVFVSRDTMPPQSVCHTEPSTWEIWVNAQLLARDVLPVESIATVYHEVRHAEQYFLAQRYEIQTHRIFEGLTTSFAMPFNDWGGAHEHVPPPIMALARSSPVLEGDERHLARMMAHRFFHASGSIDPSFMTPLTEAFCAAQDQHEADPSEENREEMDEARRAFDAGRRVYAGWWHEQDTELIGALIAGEYTEAHPDAPHTPAIDVCD